MDLAAATLKFHHSLLEEFTVSVNESMVPSFDREYEALCQLLSHGDTTKCLRHSFLHLPMLVDESYVSKIQLMLTGPILSLLLNCKLPHTHTAQPTTEEKAVSLYNAIILPLVATITNIRKKKAVLSPLQSFACARSNFQLKGGFSKTGLDDILAFVKMLCFFLRLDPKSLLARYCWEIVHMSLQAAVGTNAGTLSPIISRPVLHALQDLDLIRPALYNKGGLRFLQSFIRLLLPPDCLSLLSHLSNIQHTTLWYLSRKLGIAVQLCRTAAKHHYMHAAYPSRDQAVTQLIEMQAAAINISLASIFPRSASATTTISRSSLKAVLNSLVDIIFVPLAPVPTNVDGKSLRTIYRSTGLLYTLEQISSRMSQYAPEISDVSLMLSFYITCVQRLTNMHHNMLLQGSKAVKGTTLPNKKATLDISLYDKLDYHITKILLVYFSHLHCFTATTSEYQIFTDTMVSILRWSPVPMPSVIDILLDFMRQSMEVCKINSLDATIIYHLSISFAHICTSLATLKGCSWFDSVEASNITALLTRVVPFIYKEYVPFLLDICRVTPTAFQDIACVLHDILRIFPTALQNITRELVHPTSSGSMLYAACKSIHETYFLTVSNGRMCALEDALALIFAVPWKNDLFSQRTNGNMLKLLCDTVISLIEFCYASMHRIKKELPNNVLITVFEYAINAVLPYGHAYFVAIVLCFVSQYVTFLNFNDKKYCLQEFLKAAEDLRIIHFLKYLVTVSVAFDSTDARADICALTLIVLKGGLLARRVLIEHYSVDYTEEYLRIYDTIAKDVFIEILTEFRAAKGARLDALLCCLVYLSVESMTCFISPGSVLSGRHLYLAEGHNGAAKRKYFQKLQSIAHSSQVKKWVTLTADNSTVFQQTTYTVTLSDSERLPEDSTVKLLFLSFQPLVLCNASIQHTTLLSSTCLDYFYMLGADIDTGLGTSTATDTGNLHPCLIDFIYSCIVSADPYTLRTIADFIIKSRLIPAFFTTANRDAVLNLHCLEKLMRQCSSFILFQEVSIYVLKKLGRTLPEYYALASQRAHLMDRNSFEYFLFSSSLLFQVKMIPQLGCDMGKSTYNRELMQNAGVLVPGNRKIIRMPVLSVGHAQASVVLKSADATVFTYINRCNICTISLAFSITDISESMEKPQKFIYCSTISYRVPELNCSVDIGVSNHRNSVSIPMDADWAYIAVKFTAANLTICCHATAQEVEPPVLSIPLATPVTSNTHIQLDLDAVIKVFGYDQSTLSTLKHVSRAYLAHIYPIVIYPQPSSEQPHFLRSQSPTFTWTCAESLGYIFRDYDYGLDTANETMRAVLPHEAWCYDCNGILQTLSSLLLPERVHSGKAPHHKYEMEHELVLLLKLLHMLQDAVVEEQFSKYYGYKLLMSYLCNLPWESRIQALYISVRYLQSLIAHTKTTRQPHLLLLIAKLYHELVVIPYVFWLPDRSSSYMSVDGQPHSWSPANRSFYVALSELHYTIFSEGLYSVKDLTARDTPTCFILYNLILAGTAAAAISHELAPDQPCDIMKKVSMLILSATNNVPLHTDRLIYLLKCLSLPLPINIPSLAEGVVTLIQSLYSKAIHEEEYSLLKASPVIADLHLHEKIILVFIVLRLEQAPTLPVMMQRICNEWTGTPCSYTGLLDALLELTKSANNSDVKGLSIRSTTTLCNIGDFIALLLTNLLTRREYDRYYRALMGYVILPAVKIGGDADEVTPIRVANAMQVDQVLGMSSDDIYTEYLPTTIGLLSITTIISFVQLEMDIYALASITPAQDNFNGADYSACIVRYEVFKRLLTMLSAFASKSGADSTISTVLSVLHFVCPSICAAKRSDELIEALDKLLTEDSLLQSNTNTIFQKEALSLIRLQLNNYFKAVAEQVGKKIEVLRTSAALDTLPFPVGAQSSQWLWCFPEELQFCYIGSLFADLPKLDGAGTEDDGGEIYVCLSCMSTVQVSAHALSIARNMYGGVCVICSYRAAYKLPPLTVSVVAQASELPSFTSFVSLEMMNNTNNTLFTTNSQPKLDSKTKTEQKTWQDGGSYLSNTISTASVTFYQRLLEAKEAIVAYFLRPHSLYKPVHSLSSQKLIMLSPSMFSYPSMRISPTTIQSEINGCLQRSCLTDISGSLPLLPSSNLRQYNVPSNQSNCQLIEFGDVLLVSLLQTKHGVLYLHVQLPGEKSEKSEKQGMPLADEIIIMSKCSEREGILPLGVESSFVAGAGRLNRALLVNQTRFDQHSDSDEDSIVGSLQHTDDSTSVMFKERQEEESFAILRKLMCLKDNARSVHLTDSFAERQDGFGRRITYGLYDYWMSLANRNYQKHKEAEFSLEFSQIMYMIPFYFINTQPAVQILDASGAVYVIVFKTQEYAVKLLHSYGVYRRNRSTESSGSSFGSSYYYMKSPYKRKGILLSFDSIVTSFQADLIANLRLLITKRMTASSSLAATQLSLFTILSVINLITGRSPVVSYIYSIFPSVSPHKARPRDLRYPVPAQSNVSLCKSIMKYAEMALNDAENAIVQDRASVAAAVTFLETMLEYCSQTLSNASDTASMAPSSDIISVFMRELNRANLPASVLKAISATPVFRTFVSNNMTLSYYCFSVEPFTSLQRNLQSGCLDAFSRLFIGLRSHWEKVELGSTFHEAVPELFYTLYPFINVNNLQLSSDAEYVTGIMQSTPSQAALTITMQRVTLESLAFQGQATGAGLRSWLEMIFGDRQQSLRALNLFPNSTVDCAPSEASIATSLYFGTYPARIQSEEAAKLLSQLENMHTPTRSSRTLSVQHSVSLAKRLVAVQFEPLISNAVQDVTGKYELVFRGVHESAICVAGKHFVHSDYVSGLLWTTPNCTVIDRFLLYFDDVRQEVSVFELSAAFLDALRGTGKGAPVTSVGGSSRDTEPGSVLLQDVSPSSASCVFSTHIVILGFIFASPPGTASLPHLLTSVPVGSLVKQNKPVGSHIATLRLATTLSKGYGISKNVVVTRIESAGYMPLYGHILHLYTNHGLVVAGLHNMLSVGSHIHLSIVQHYTLDMGYYADAEKCCYIHVPSLSLVCCYSSNILHVMEYNLLHRVASYGVREATSPYLLTKLKISYEDSLRVTHCAIHEKQGLIAVGLSIYNSLLDQQRLQYSIYVYTLGNVHLKAITVPARVDSILFFGGYDDGFGGYMLVNQRYVYDLTLDASADTDMLLEANIQADTLVSIDGAIVGCKKDTIIWYG